MQFTEHRCTWNDTACLDADHIVGWGAFELGCNTTIDVHDGDLLELASRMLERNQSPDRNLIAAIEGTT
jgi:hypothetical protein